MRFPTSYRWTVYVNPNSPKGWHKTRFWYFSSKFELLSKKVCCKVSSCENFQRQSCSYIIPLSNGPYMDCGRRPHLPKICTQSDQSMYDWQSSLYVLYWLILSFCCAPKRSSPFFLYIYTPQNPLLMIQYELSTSYRWRFLSWVQLHQQTGSAIAG